MIPEVDILMEEIEEVNYPTNTYLIQAVNEEENCISGYTDDLDAIKQAINLILQTERYEFLIYSWDYGVELVDLIGKPMPYIMSEIPRRIKEALTQDERIVDVTDFEFEKNRNKLHTTFKVVTEVGDISTELEVNV